MLKVDNARHTGLFAFPVTPLREHFRGEAEKICLMRHKRPFLERPEPRIYYFSSSIAFIAPKQWIRSHFSSVIHYYQYIN
jgi:hypothetical protein